MKDNASIISAIFSVHRILLILGVTGLIIFGIFGFNLIFHIILLYCTSIILAVVLSFLTNWIKKILPLNQILALSVVLILLVCFTFLFFRIFGPRIMYQISHISNSVKEGIETIRSLTQKYPWLQHILNNPNSHDKFISGFTGVFENVFGKTMTFISEAIFVLLMAIFLAANPSLYITSIVKLFLPEKRSLIQDILDANWRALRNWFYGRIITMITIAFLTAIGLFISGIPLALSLGIFAGILDFIPFIGPFISAILTILVTLAQDPFKIIWVIVVYLAVHILEDFLTPVIQFGVAQLPPALLVSVQILLFTLGGFVGILIAEPFTMIIIVFIQIGYIRAYLHEDVAVLGEKRVK